MSSIKQEAIKSFRSHVSPDRADFFEKHGLNFVMGKREGCYLWDIDGDKRLFNCHSNGGVFNLGHRHPDVIATLQSALNDLDIGNHVLLSSHRAALAKALAESMPGDIQYSVFSVGGGEAVDVAIKLARGYTGRTKIVSAKGGYHGHTGYSLATGDDHYLTPFGPRPTDFMQALFGSVSALGNMVDETTAAVILETVPATLGVVVPPSEYFSEVRRICKDAGAQLIMDEVQTGLGRTGKLWGFEHFNGEPDIVVVGKGLSGGIYPIAATCYRPHLQSVFEDDPFIHISTFGGAELGCAVGLKVLEISSQPEFLHHVNEVAARFSRQMATLLERHQGFLVEFRQLGMMMGIRMKNDLCGPILTKAAFDKDLLMVYANNDRSVCQLLPSLTASFEQVDEIMEKLEAAVKKAKIMVPVVRLKEGLAGIGTKIKQVWG